MPWWLDHILQDRRFADYFAERLARAYVGTEDGPFILYRRRRFVAWLAGRSWPRIGRYDALVRDLIADDGLWTDKPATNFVSVTCQQDKKNQPDPVRLAGRVTRAFLGLRLDCAQCHNHPFAAWKQADFQGLAAFFGQTHVGFTGIHDGPGEYVVEDRKTQVERTDRARACRSPRSCCPRTARAGNSWRPGSRTRKIPTSPAPPSTASGRCCSAGRWSTRSTTSNRTNPSRPRLQILADDFAAHGFDLRRLIRVIASTEVFRLDSVADGDEGEAKKRPWPSSP